MRRVLPAGCRAVLRALSTAACLTGAAATLLAGVALHPAAADAAFSTTVTAQSSVVTLQLAAPASVGAVVSCPGTDGHQGSFAVTLNAIAPVPRATGYLLTVTDPAGRSRTLAVSALPATLKVTGQKGIWTYKVQATVQGWVGLPWTASACQ
ncbi:hypothetical protein KIH31_17625 [Paenarthrobacter sp. DKR-5]|uniref:hypothetical protein n=1 Tax=Paenarthrobacter sp. DKR-5 TaxID=2835535 RepID=UPI001BDD1767|nr:hypothetical protein [Paenarthrobacter sp. DKR-5]MBT1004408.1 hypothetical protein [Paenarthrobacter sp. DKR-5]